jgi:ArsR family transcriptional regulator
VPNLVRIFKALGDETRLRIIASLQDQERCVCDLACHLGLPQPTLSHHLKVLRDAGLVIGEKSGPLIQCRVNTKAFADNGIELKTISAQAPFVQTAVRSVPTHRGGN